MIVAGTGSRSLQTEPDPVRAATVDAVVGKLVDCGAELVRSGGAEGWDACLTVAATRAGVPYELWLPYPGYLDWYWAQRSVTGCDRSSAAARMVDGAALVVHVCDSRTATDPHTGDLVSSNLVRNCRMIDGVSMVLGFNPTSPGTRHGVLECERHGVMSEWFDLGTRLWSQRVLADRLPGFDWT